MSSGERYSEAGIATAGMVNGVIDSRGKAYEVFVSTLPIGRPSIYDQEKIMDAVDLDKAISVAPGWLDVPRLLSEIMRLNNNTIWREILRRADSRKVQELQSSFEGVHPSDIPRQISAANMPLYGFTPVLALTAVFGNDLFSKGIMSQSSPKNGPWNTTLSEAANYFAKPVQDMHELIHRMKELFPDEITDQQSFSAFNLIKRNRIFNNQGRTLMCLVINPTQYFFEAYGRALREDEVPGDYGYEFKEAILSTSGKVRRAEELAEATAREAWERDRRV